MLVRREDRRVLRKHSTASGWRHEAKYTWMHDNDHVLLIS